MLMKFLPCSAETAPLEVSLLNQLYAAAVTTNSALIKHRNVINNGVEVLLKITVKPIDSPENMI